jgi:hypothetical protein
MTTWEKFLMWFFPTGLRKMRKEENSVTKLCVLLTMMTDDADV